MLLKVLAALLSFSVAHASHSWGTYHWNTGNITTGDSTTAQWRSYLNTSRDDWNLSPKINLIVEPGLNTPGSKTCNAYANRVETCTADFGNNGWLGIARIWLDSTSHIYAGAVLMNDYYFNRPDYNTTAWKNLVMCQEVGHVLGLDHVDENFDNAPSGTCMDYSSDPEPNQHPNQHDYDQLMEIYDHSHTTDSNNTTSKRRGKKMVPLPGSKASLLGKKVREHVYETNDKNTNNRIVSFIFPAHDNSLSA